jgi:hypothetical protein
MLSFLTRCAVFAATCLLAAELVQATDNRMSPRRIESIKPVNVDPVPFRTVSGTITVRLNGVLVDPQQMKYMFAPEFPANHGRPRQIETGTFVVRAHNVPADRPYTLTISAGYNDTIFGRDGVIERRGRGYTGSTRVEIPYGGDADFGVLFLDLR